VSLEPRFHNPSIYVEARLYDIRQTNGVATGLVSPSPSGVLFAIVEAGARWTTGHGEPLARKA